MKKTTLFLFVIFLTSQTMTQWVNNYWGNNTGDNQILNSKGLAVATDENDFCYVTGYTSNPVSGNDIILIKYTSGGDTVFTRVYKGSKAGDDRAFGIIVDENGNIYLAGQLYADGKGLELVLLKYNNNGTLLWSKTYGATSVNKDDKAFAITKDEDNNIYVTGFCTGDNGAVSLLVQKYQPDGTRVWSKTENSNRKYSSQGQDITADNRGYIYVTGYSSIGNNAQSSDIVTIKYSEAGNKIWLNIFNGQQQLEDRAFGIAVDESDNVYVTGYTALSKNSNNTSAVLLKYGSGGALICTRTVEQGGNSSEDKAFGIIVDNNFIFIAGQIASASNGMDYMTAKYNQNGERIWLSTYNGPANGDDMAYAIGMLNDNKVVVTGTSMGINNDYDFATVIINKKGEIHQSSRYSMGKNTNDIAKDLTVSKNNNIFVTGFSELKSNPAFAPCGISTQMIMDENDGTAGNTNTPRDYKLEQNYPNPFNPSTTIKFSIAENSLVNLIIYDIMGREVEVIVNNELIAGQYSITYTNRNLSSGIYFYSLSAGNYKDVKKMTIIK